MEVKKFELNELMVFIKNFGCTEMTIEKLDNKNCRMIFKEEIGEKEFKKLYLSNYIEQSKEYYKEK